MAFKKFKKLFISLADLTDPDNLLRIINSLQTNIENSVGSMTVKTQNDSLIINNISLTTGANLVSHGLGKNLVGWKLVRIRGDARVWDDQDNNASPNLTLKLQSSANVVVDLEVF